MNMTIEEAMGNIRLIKHLRDLMDGEEQNDIDMRCRISELVGLIELAGYDVDELEQKVEFEDAMAAEGPWFQCEVCESMKNGPPAQCKVCHATICSDCNKATTETGPVCSICNEKGCTE